MCVSVTECEFVCMFLTVSVCVYACQCKHDLLILSYLAMIEERGNCCVGTTVCHLKSSSKDGHPYANIGMFVWSTIQKENILHSI